MNSLSLLAQVSQPKQKETVCALYEQTMTMMMTSTQMAMATMMMGTVLALRAIMPGRVSREQKAPR